MQLSKILSWYKSDFGSTDMEVLLLLLVNELQVAKTVLQYLSGPNLGHGVVPGGQDCTAVPARRQLGCSSGSRRLQLRPHQALHVSRLLDFLRQFF